MIRLISKNDILPKNLDAEQLEEIFRHIREHPKQPQSKRVEGFLELLSTLRDDLSKSEKVRVIVGLRNTLSAYQWVVQISPTPEGFRPIHMIADRGRLSLDDIWEREAIRDLLKVVPYLGARPRIRRCANTRCREWFFAGKRLDKEWCGDSCKQQHYDSDPKQREKKKLHMRKLRRDAKEREEMTRKHIGFGSRVKVRAKKSVR
jgi:hypothetical protein